MESTIILTNQQIEDSYNKYSDALYRYILYKVDRDDELAKDILHDAFLRLLEHRGEIRIDTVRSLLYTIVYNLIIDYVRKHEKMCESISEYYKGYNEASDMVESDLNVIEISALERMKVQSMPEQRQKVYSMSRFLNLSSEEIASRMNLSCKTVENHLYIGRKEVRNYIKQCI